MKARSVSQDMDTTMHSVVLSEEPSKNALTIDEDHDKTVKPSTSRLSKAQKWRRGLQRTFGTSFLCLVGTIYAVQGFKSFSSLAVQYMFKDVLHLQPSVSQALTTTMYIPWGIKPLYGIMSDSLPIFGYRRRSYLFLSAILATFAYFSLSIPSLSSTALMVTFFLFLTNLSTAVADVVIDARVVEMSRLDPINGANDLQSLSWSMMSVGGIIGSLLGGPAMDVLGARCVFALAAIGPLVIIILSIYMKEDKVSLAEKRKPCMRMARDQFTLLTNSIKVPLVWKTALVRRRRKT